MSKDIDSLLNVVIMPESPEVRTIADQLGFYMRGRDLLSVELLGGKPSMLAKKKDYETLNAKLPMKISRVFAKSKLLVMELEDEKEEDMWWIFVTFGMTGKITTEESKHSHIKFTASKSAIGYNTFYYTDARKFGNVDVSTDSDVYEKRLKALAPPIGLAPEGMALITKDEFKAGVKKCAKRLRSELACCIMDQKSICSGVGNYLLAEGFYEAKVNPYVRCEDLSDDQIHRLFDAWNAVILKSYGDGGNSFSDYVDANNKKGLFASKLKVYRKQKDLLGHTVLHEAGPGNLSASTMHYVVEVQGSRKDVKGQEDYDDDDG